MEAISAVKSGDLGLALQELKQQIRNDPSNAKHRIFLFQLLAVRGEWTKAEEQLKSAGMLDAANLGLAAIYATALESERSRSEVFKGTVPPTLLGQPDTWHALLIEACRLSGQGNHGEAAQLREEAYRLAPATPCEVDGEPCAWIADGDSRLGPVLEVVLNGQYRWVPFDQIKTMVLEAPTDLRDLVWMPATFTWKNGGVSPALVPARYFETEAADDTQLHLARKTEWVPLGSEAYRGLGQRVLVTDKRDFALLDIRRIEFFDAG